MLDRQLLGDLSQGDVRRLLDQAEDESLVWIEFRARWLPLLAGDRLARLTIAAIPFPCCSSPDPEASRCLARRKAVRYR
jgi:hypothetical protein